MNNNIVALTSKGWSHIQLNDIIKLQKSWKEEKDGQEEEIRVDVFFGTLCNGYSTPVVIMNVYNQGCGTRLVIDDNCDIWKNIFTSTTKEEGNEYYLYLRKHGFQRVII